MNALDSCLLCRIPRYRYPWTPMDFFPPTSWTPTDYFDSHGILWFPPTSWTPANFLDDHGLFEHPRTFFICTDFVNSHGLLGLLGLGRLTLVIEGFLLLAETSTPRYFGILWDLELAGGLTRQWETFRNPSGLLDIQNWWSFDVPAS